jgi:hypothetical protein
MVIEFVQRADSVNGKRGDRWLGGWFGDNNFLNRTGILCELQASAMENGQKFEIEDLDQTVDFRGWVLISLVRKEIMVIREAPGLNRSLLAFVVPTSISTLGLYENANSYDDNVVAFYTPTGNITQDTMVFNMLVPNAKIRRITQTSNVLVYQGGREILTPGKSYKIAWDMVGPLVEEISHTDKLTELVNLVELMREPKP